MLEDRFTKNRVRHIVSRIVDDNSIMNLNTDLNIFYHQNYPSFSLQPLFEIKVSLREAYRNLPK